MLLSLKICCSDLMYPNVTILNFRFLRWYCKREQLTMSKSEELSRVSRPVPPEYNSNKCFNLVTHQLENTINIYRPEWNLINANIVINTLGIHQIARIMNVFTQAKNLINASIVINGLGIYQLAGVTNVFTQEQNHISASTVVSSSTVRQIVSSMNLHMQG